MEDASTQEENAVFFFRYQQKPNVWEEKGDRVATVRLWDLPSRNREKLTLVDGLPYALRSSSSAIALEVICDSNSSWSSLDDSTWTKFCRTIQQCLPGLKMLHFHSPHFLGDQKCKVLLEHLPSDLSHMEIAFVKGDLPQTLAQIGFSFPHLQELKLLGYRSLSLASGVLLANSLQKKTRLRKVTLRGMSSQNIKDTLKPVFHVIRSNHNLEQVHIGGQWFNETIIGEGEEPDVELRHWLPEELEPLQFGPRLNQAKQTFLSSNPITPEAFVNAIICVRDRVDCLGYLLSSVDPSLYAQQAVAKGHLE